MDKNVPSKPILIPHFRTLTPTKIIFSNMPVAAKTHGALQSSCLSQYLSPHLGSLIPKTVTLPSGVPTIPHAKVKQNGPSSQYQLKS